MQIKITSYIAQFGTVNILYTLNLDTTRSQIASIVKVKIANFKCTLRTLANPYKHLLYTVGVHSIVYPECLSA